MADWKSNKFFIANNQTKGILLRKEDSYFGVERFFGMKGVSYYRRRLGDTDLHPELLGTFFLDTDLGRKEGDRLLLKSLEADELGYHAKMTDDTETFEIETIMLMDKETGVFSRKDYLTNLDNEPHVIYSCLARYALHGDDYEIYTQSSGWCAENEGEWHRLSAGNFELTNSGGRSTDSANPFLCIRQASTGFAAAIHVLPIGNWMIKVSRTAGHRTTYAVLEAGLSNQGLRLVIQPGETLELPELLLQGFSGELQESAPILHRYLLNRWPEKTMTEAVYNTWFLDFDTVELERLKKQVKAAAQMGCKYYVVDAGWFGEGDSWWEQVGFWKERLDGAFFGKLKEFADYVRENGMQFGIWMEPERAAEGSRVYRQKPEWFRLCDTIQYDLLNPEVEDYLVGQIVDVINRYDVRWIKIDYNSDFLRDLNGENYYRYCLASDRMMKRAREACPQVIFEGCASGGLRTDIRQVMEKSANHFISDTVNPNEVIRMRQNAALRILPQFLSTWSVVAEMPFTISSYSDRNRFARRKMFTSADAEWNRILDVSPTYSAAVTLAGCPGFSGDVDTLSDNTKEELKKWIGFYHENAVFLSRCVCHLLTKPEKIDCINGWAVMQYENIDGKGSLLYAYRMNADTDTFIAYPKNLEKDGKYRVEVVEDKLSDIAGEGLLHEKDENIVTGETLYTEGVEIVCREYYDAAVVKLTRI